MGANNSLFGSQSEVKIEIKDRFENAIFPGHFPYILQYSPTVFWFCINNHTDETNHKRYHCDKLELIFQTAVNFGIRSEKYIGDPIWCVNYHMEQLLEKTYLSNDTKDHLQKEAQKELERVPELLKAQNQKISVNKSNEQTNSTELNVKSSTPM